MRIKSTRVSSSNDLLVRLEELNHSADFQAQLFTAGSKSEKRGIGGQRVVHPHYRKPDIETENLYSCVLKTAKLQETGALRHRHGEQLLAAYEY